MHDEQIDISHLLRDPVYITWIRGKKRQKMVQKRIFRLLKKQKFFILNTGDELNFKCAGNSGQVQAVTSALKQT